MQASNRSRESYALNTLFNEQREGDGNKLQDGTTDARTPEAAVTPPTSSGGRRAADSDHEEEGSVWSAKSTRMLIRKDVEYSVSHAPRGEGD